VRAPRQRQLSRLAPPADHAWSSSLLPLSWSSSTVLQELMGLTSGTALGPEASGRWAASCAWNSPSSAAVRAAFTVVMGGLPSGSCQRSLWERAEWTGRRARG